MPTRRKFHLAYLAVAALLAAGGCGSKAESPDSPAAAVNGQGGNSPGTASPASPPRAPQPPANPVVVIQTSLGEIVVELDPAAAPTTTDEFLFYVKKGQYNGTIFHQVIKDQAIVAGQYEPDLTERPGRTPIPNEAAKAAKAGLRNVRGTIALMRDPTIIDSAACQFYINVGDNHTLDHNGDGPQDYGYCPFGRVQKGSMDVVEKIAQVQVADKQVQVTDRRKGKATFDRLPVEAVVIKQIVVR